MFGLLIGQVQSGGSRSRFAFRNGQRKENIFRASTARVFNILYEMQLSEWDWRNSFKKQKRLGWENAYIRALEETDYLRFKQPRPLLRLVPESRNKSFPICPLVLKFEREKPILTKKQRKYSLMNSQNFFDTDKLATELKISRDDYITLKRSVREEFPNDEMMYQLHLLRALHAASEKASSSFTE